MTTQLWELTATEVVRAQRAGEISPVELVRALLDRIETTDRHLMAWETVDAEGALTAARALEERRNERRPRDLLFGLPFGAKDIFHVRGLPTTAHFDPYRGRPAGEDSGAVAFLREAGAIPLGKTVTVQFAWGRDVVRTRNPYRLDRTPGGSSSGSGAAVGGRQVPAALGTQTGGSNLRPAAYCGAVGLKPTLGRVSRIGLIPISWTLDHPGIIVRTVADAALLLQALARHDLRDPFSVKREPEDFVAAVSGAGTAGAPRLGLVRELLDRAEPEVREATVAAARRLEGAGGEIREVSLPVPMDLLLSVHRIIGESEGASVHAEQHSRLAEHYRPQIRINIEVGQLIPAAVYVHALRLRRRLRSQMLELFTGLDGVVGPTAPNLPPPVAESNGNPTFQSIWTLFGFPNVTVPSGLSAEGLPHGFQIVAPFYAERDLLRTAAWVETVFGPLPPPGLEC